MRRLRLEPASNIERYILETFTERRATCWIEEPFTGGAVDKQDMGEPPDIEDIPATPPEYFKSYVYHQEIPYTANIETCEECDGEGKYECPTCLGQGWEFCPYCRGNKWYPLAVDSFDGDCMKCQGSGERTCWVCNGDEEVECKTCGGAGEMKSYIRLLVIWSNHTDDYIVEKGSALKAHRLRMATGINVCEEEGLTLMPLTHFPISAVSMASVQLIQYHAREYKEEKVLKQRHRVSIIPVASVRYQWKKHEGLFYVYGNERYKIQSFQKASIESMDPILYSKYHHLQERDVNDFLLACASLSNWCYLTKKTVMDVGCGSGNTSCAWFLSLFLQVKRLIAIDKSEEMIKLAKVLNPHPKIEYMVADIADELVFLILFYFCKSFEKL
ncbi:protein SSUH2 [Trichonephila clavata]|uniref:Protein SSUH2 n=1 Tax=Trichonephila clavata TaxID=2740835 RepID=A0A8X6HHU9_TRICU|nr:protein SSUH2 [Trichonephila clavata]